MYSYYSCYRATASGNPDAVLHEIERGRKRNTFSFRHYNRLAKETPQARMGVKLVIFWTNYLVTHMVTLWKRTPFGRRLLLSFQCLERLWDHGKAAFEPLIIHHSNPWNITVSRVFALSILSTNFLAYPWNSNASKNFHFGVTFIRLSFCKPRQGIGPWSPMSNISAFNALRFSALSTLSLFAKITIKAGSPNSLLDDVVFLLSFRKTTIRITRFRTALLLYGAYLEHWRAAVKCFFFLVP